MDAKNYKFVFDDFVDMAAVENALLMAVIAAEGIHGRSQVNLDATYSTDKPGRTCRVNADNQVGYEIARVFTEFLNLEIGEDAFTISHEPPQPGVVPKTKNQGDLG
jgi:hypothetical protein